MPYLSSTYKGEMTNEQKTQYDELKKWRINIYNETKQICMKGGYETKEGQHISILDEASNFE